MIRIRFTFKLILTFLILAPATVPTVATGAFRKSPKSVPRAVASGVFEAECPLATARGTERVASLRLFKSSAVAAAFLTRTAHRVERRASDKPEDAPIVERRMDFHDFTFSTTDGRSFNLREYASGKRITIVSFVAGWCANSNRNGHVAKRLYDKYRDRGLGMIAVTEYSSPEEVRIHVNGIGIDYPVVTETSKRDARKKTLHYKYRQIAGDKRKWGTPFYVIIDRRDIEPAAQNAPIARRVYTVSGEIIESEAEQFIEEHLRKQ